MKKIPPPPTPLRLGRLHRYNFSTRVRTSSGYIHLMFFLLVLSANCGIDHILKERRKWHERSTKLQGLWELLSGTYYDRNYDNSKEQTGNNQSVNDVTNCKRNQKEKHFFFSFYKVYLVNPTQIESRYQKISRDRGSSFATILGSGIKI